ncbi:MAG: hypothetical protein WCR20_01430 [Verrucomicrobiota bacterium]
MNNSVALNTTEITVVIKKLHSENVLHARITAENAVLIGVLLHQLQESFEGEGFVDSVAVSTGISPRTCNRYMAIAEEVRNQAAKSLPPVAPMPGWAELSPASACELAAHVRGQNVSELYRAYGIAKEKIRPCHHPITPRTADERIADQNAHAAALVTDTLNSLSILLLDLESRDGTLASRVPRDLWHQLHRQTIALNKVIGPMTRASWSPSEDDNA